LNPKFLKNSLHQCLDKICLDAENRLLEVQGDKIILSPKTTSYTELLAGSLKNVYGRTPEEVNDYIRKERETWGKTLS
jgi:hypothetical protein